jgi:hypothetical protein
MNSFYRRVYICAIFVSCIINGSEEFRGSIDTVTVVLAPSRDLHRGVPVYGPYNGMTSRK